MKTKMLLLITYACFLFTAQAQEWGFDNAFKRDGLSTVCTQGPDIIHVAGDNIIAKSTDGGNSWSRQYFNDRHHIMRAMATPMTLIDMIFCDQKNGFIIEKFGFILKTTDGGNEWEIEDVETIIDRKRLNAIACTDLNNIWVVGDNGVVLRSTDSGETWQPIEIAPDQNRYNLKDIAFKDNTGYIAGGSPAVLYKTEDGGQTWEHQQITNDRDDSEFHSLCLTENKAYMLCYSYHFRSLYQTQDYETWSEISLDFFPNDISFSDDMVGYALGSSETSKYAIFKTENGGENWIPMELNYGPKGYYYEPLMRNTGSCQILVNGTTGYAVSGSKFFRTPSPDYLEIQSIKDLNVSDPLVSLYNRESRLLIQSNKLPIVSVQIMDISGKILTSQRWDGTERNEKEINTSAIPEGLYLVKTTLSDNSVYINKWIKK